MDYFSPVIHSFWITFSDFCYTYTLSTTNKSFLIRPFSNLLFLPFSACAIQASANIFPLTAPLFIYFPTNRSMYSTYSTTFPEIVWTSIMLSPQLNHWSTFSRKFIHISLDIMLAWTLPTVTGHIFHVRAAYVNSDWVEPCLPLLSPFTFVRPTCRM